MSRDGLIAQAQVGSGALSLYQGRLVHRSDALTGTIPLAQLASVQIAYKRESGKLGGAIALAVLAGLLRLSATPLREWLSGLAAPHRQRALGGGEAERQRGAPVQPQRGKHRTDDEQPRSDRGERARDTCQRGQDRLQHRLQRLSAPRLRGCGRRGRNLALIEFAEAIAVRLAEQAPAR